MAIRRAMLVPALAGVLAAGCGKDAPPARPREFTQYQAVLRARSPESAEFSSVSAIDVYIRDPASVMMPVPEWFTVIVP